MRRHRVYKRTKLDKDWEKYQSASKEARKIGNNAYNTFIKNSVISNEKKHSKRFFSFIKSKKTSIIGVSPLIDNDTIQTKDGDIAETLNKQFASVFSMDDGTTPQINDPQGPAIGSTTLPRMAL